MMETMWMTRIYRQKQHARRSHPASSSFNGSTSSTYQLCYALVPGDWKNPSGKGLTKGYSTTEVNARRDKRHIGVVTPDNEEDRASIQSLNMADQEYIPSDPLPDWLAKTFTKLPQKHPLRMLLPVDIRHTHSSEMHGSPGSTAVGPVTSSHEREPVFTFDANEALTSPTLVSNNPPKSLYCMTPEDLVPEVGRSPVFNPFSTPGPASTISRCLTPMKCAIDINMFGSPLFTDRVDYTAECPMEYPAQPLTLLSDQYTFGIPPLAYHDSPEPYHIGATGTQDARVEGGGLSYLYTSPDPERRPRRPSSDESPTGHCLDSDLLPGPFPLNVNELDFHWVPFNRKSVDLQSPKHNTVSYAHFIDRVQTNQHSGGAEGVYRDGPVHRASSPDGHFRFQVTPNNAESHPHGGQPGPQNVLGFLPRVYLSPLKGPCNYFTGDPGAYPDQISQRSNDSIESWSD